MTIKPKKGEPVSEGTLAYQRARTQFRMHSMLLEALARSGMKQADVARMVGKKPEVVNRILGEAANYNLDTLSDFLFALCGNELSDSPQEIPNADQALPAWLRTKSDSPTRRDQQTDTDSVTILVR